MATPSALEFAQWQSEQRRAANQARMVNLAQLRQEAAQQRQEQAALMFKAAEGEKDRAAALERVQVAGKLDIEQEEARAKAYLDRLDSQEKSRQFRKFAGMGIVRLPDESDESYVTRANKALADQAQSIFSNVDEYRRRSMSVAQRETTERASKINRLAMQTVVPTLSKSEQAAVAKNPAAFVLILQKNPGAAALYQSTLQRLDENTPPISAQGAIELQGLGDEAKRWEAVGSKLIGDEDFAGAMTYFARSKPNSLATRAAFEPAGRQVGATETLAPPPPVSFAPPQQNLGGMIQQNAPPEFRMVDPNRGAFSLPPDQTETLFRLNPTVPRRPVFGTPFGTTPPEFQF